MNIITCIEKYTEINKNEQMFCRNMILNYLLAKAASVFAIQPDQFYR